jgi:hypothetical protein
VPSAGQGSEYRPEHERRERRDGEDRRVRSELLDRVD